MEIKASELRQGVEVDMPVEWKNKPVRQRTIRYNQENKKYELMDIKTKEIHYSYSKLSELVKTTNDVYGYTDIAVDD